MLKFKVKDSTHQAISVISKYLCILGFIGAVGFFGFTMVKNYQEAKTILSDAVVLDAEVTLDDVVYEKGRKGRSKATYHFSYHYEAGGKNYNKSFTTSESNANKYIDSESVQIAYSKADPTLSGKVEQLEKNSSIGSLSWRGIVAFFGLMFLAAVVYGLITSVLFINKDKPEEDD
ncbi:MAG: DUF3592 domain-containing protein [Marinicella sp.]|nr:DUF3592 domain-containing protein [Xanthomonadales bacterium]